MQVEQINSIERLVELDSGSGVAPLDVESFVRHRPDAHWVVLDGGLLQARGSAWWKDTPPYEEHRVGVIGHFAAGGAEPAGLLLAHATEALAERGSTIAVGPMDGNTWRAYRFVTEAGGEPPFFMEPWHPAAYPEYFIAAGFEPLAGYASALNPDLDCDDPILPALEEKAAEAGVSTVLMDSAQGDATLQRIYALSLEGFARNLLYTPISASEFLGQYRRILPFVRPELVLLARKGEDLVGFMFAVPDILQARRAETIDTVVLKSVAVAPAFQGLGIGGLLMARVQQAARKLGYKRAIYALYHDDNQSRIITERYAGVMRRYTLYGKALAP